MRRLIVVVTISAMSLLGLMTLGGAAQATTPGKNGLIVFSADTGAGNQLYTIRPNGTGLHQLTHLSGAEAVNADWSPDGHRIVFELGSEAHAGVAIINADGTGMRDLTPTGFQGQPSFTPDGHHVVYDCDCPDGQGVFLIRDDGSGRRRLTTSPFPGQGFDTDANVSPDGHTVTFVRAQVPEQLQALYAVNIDGTNERQLTAYSLEVAIKHDWAPDGRHIVLTNNADYPNNRSPNVTTVRPDGSHQRLLTHFSDGQRWGFTGSYSPDGRWIVFRIQNRETERFALFKTHPDGSGKQLIARFPFSPRFIDWGPGTSHNH